MVKLVRFPVMEFATKLPTTSVFDRSVVVSLPNVNRELLADHVAKLVVVRSARTSGVAVRRPTKCSWVVLLPSRLMTSAAETFATFPLTW